MSTRVNRRGDVRVYGDIWLRMLALVAPRDQGIEDLYFLRHQAEIGDNAIADQPDASEPAETTGTAGTHDETSE